jgi:hypothetical protein
MAELTLEALGIPIEEIIERVVERIAEKAMQDWSAAGATGRPHVSFAQLIEERVIDRANDAIDHIAAENVLPNITSYVENLCLQETNKWGEATGRKMTFTEYLVERAEKWITEPVNYQGKSKGEDSFSWRPYGTRISYLIHEHLDSQIGTAIKEALKDLNSSVAKGLRDAVMIQIREVLDRLKVEVKA